MGPVIFILFFPNEQLGGGGGGGGGAAKKDYFLFLFVFSRPQAGSATVYSIFFGLATNTYAECDKQQRHNMRTD